jgi:ATP-dependent protease ClpP protease subunit
MLALDPPKRRIAQVMADLDRDNFMSAYEAVEYGLIDRVIESNKKI